jgi:hypothetical protein
MVATGEHAAPHRPTLRLRVDPRHAVAVVVVALGHGRQQRVEVGDAVGVDRHLAGLDRQQPDGGVEDDAGEAHPADGGPEQRRLHLRADELLRPIRHQQRERHDVQPERTLAVVVLPVDVAGDGPADGDEPRARRDRHEPPARHDDAQQVVDADPGGHGDRAGGRVEHGLMCGAEQAQHQPTRVLRRIAVAAAQPAHERATSTGFLQRSRHLMVRQLEHVGQRGVGTAPPGERTVQRRHQRSTPISTATPARAR